MNTQEFDPIDKPPVAKPEVDPRLQEVASLHTVLKESENGYTFVAYASDPNQALCWIIHVMEGNAVIYDTTAPRIHGFSHHDLTVLGNAIDLLKRQFNPDIHVHTSI